MISNMLLYLPGTLRELRLKVNLIWSSSAAASDPRSHTLWSCPPSSWQHTHTSVRNYRQGVFTSMLQPPFTNSITYSVQVGVGIGVQGGKGLCSPPVRSDKEYLMLVYSRPLILLFWREKKKKKKHRMVGDNSRKKKKAQMKKWGVVCTPAPPLCVSAMFLYSAVRPYRWIGTAPRSAPSPSAENEPSGWFLAHRCHSPPLQHENNISHRLLHSVWTYCVNP